MSSPAKLTDTQRAILFEASQRKDRCLIPPKTLKAAAAQKVATKLLKASLVREIKAKTGMEAWRRDEETGQAYSLKLTDAGLKAIAADERDSQSIPSTAVPQNTNEDSSNAKTAANMAAARSATAAPTATAPRQGTKIARVIELLQREGGRRSRDGEGRSARLVRYGATTPWRRSALPTWRPACRASGVPVTVYDQKPQGERFRPCATAFQIDHWTIIIMQRSSDRIGPSHFYSWRHTRNDPCGVRAFQRRRGKRRPRRICTIGLCVALQTFARPSSPRPLRPELPSKASLEAAARYADRSA